MPDVFDQYDVYNATVYGIPIIPLTAISVVFVAGISLAILRQSNNDELNIMCSRIAEIYSTNNQLLELPELPNSFLNII